MARDTKAGRIALEERLEEAEEMLCAGISPGRVESTLAKKHSITPRQARNYIAKVYERWDRQTVVDAPHRREKVIRMAERCYARCIAAKEYSPAVQSLNLLAKLSGAFGGHTASRDKLLAEISEPAADPKQILPSARKILYHELVAVFSNESLDPERRLRWISELSAKMGMISSASETQETITRIETLIAEQRLLTSTVRLENAGEIPLPETARGGRGRRGPRPVPGRGPGSEEGEK